MLGIKRAENVNAQLQNNVFKKLVIAGSENGISICCLVYDLGVVGNEMKLI